MSPKGIILALAVLLSGSVNAQVKAIPGLHEVRVSQQTPSCRIVEQRILQMDKMFFEVHDLSKKVLKKNSSKANRKDLIAILQRIDSSAGIAPNQDVEITALWKIPPEALDIPEEELMVSVETPRHDWLSTWDQRLSVLNFKKKRRRFANYLHHQFP